MGGLGPGIGGLEILVIGLVALLVVGPKDLPILMRRVGQWMARARSMAAEFRASFDEMARQSELDELRKEVEALRHANPVHRLGAARHAEGRRPGRARSGAPDDAHRAASYGRHRRSVRPEAQASPARRQTGDGEDPGARRPGRPSRQA